MKELTDYLKILRQKNNTRLYPQRSISAPLYSKSGDSEKTTLEAFIDGGTNPADIVEETIDMRNGHANDTFLATALPLLDPQAKELLIRYIAGEETFNAVCTDLGISSNEGAFIVQQAITQLRNLKHAPKDANGWLSHDILNQAAPIIPPWQEQLAVESAI
ncbi:MAG: hypothetical protein KJ915_05955 [Candidatus Omnitrophica bacterium]|nr:hypothetical protein [Candidatus Omnitrophota bacterium]